jgi:hypothetical protein
MEIETNFDQDPTAEIGMANLQLVAPGSRAWYLRTENFEFYFPKKTL